MDINIQVNGFRDAEDIEAYCLDEIERSPFAKYSFISSIISIVRTSAEINGLCKATIEVRFKKGKEMFTEEDHVDIRKAFDIALDKMKRRVRKYKERYYDSSHTEFKSQIN